MVLSFFSKYIFDVAFGVVVPPLSEKFKQGEKGGRGRRIQQKIENNSHYLLPSSLTLSSLYNDEILKEAKAASFDAGPGAPPLGENLKRNYNLFNYHDDNHDDTNLTIVNNNID